MLTGCNSSNLDLVTSPLPGRLRFGPSDRGLRLVIVGEEDPVEYQETSGPISESNHAQEHQGLQFFLRECC